MLLKIIKSVTFFLAGFTIASSTFAYVNPGNPLGHVNDFANILTSDEKTFLETKLASFNANTGNEIAIATIQTLDGDTIENFAVKLFEDWKIGKEKEDNGLLILVAPTEREVRIEVGYGLEPVITDIAAFSIIRDTITPQFRDGNYFLGLDRAADQIIGLIKNDPEAIASVNSNRSDKPQIDFFYLIFIFFAFGVNVLAHMAKTKSWWLGGVFGLVLGGIFIGLVGAGICAVIGLVVDFILSKWGGKWFKGGPGGKGPWFIGGPGIGGRNGGGFGGFGGGMSGGGGASGRW